MRLGPLPGEADWRRAYLPGESWLRDHYEWFAAAVGILLVINELVAWGHDLRKWDWLFVSGFVTLVAILKISLLLPQRLHETLSRLVSRKVVHDRQDDILGYENDLYSRSRRYALVGGAVLPVVLTLAWVFAKWGHLGPYASTVVTQALAAIPVGFFVGRTVNYGRIGTSLSAERFEVALDPEHLDGCAGLRPVGEFYFFQAGLLAVPAAYLAVWWLAIPFFGERYVDWRVPYLGLLAFVIACEVFAFFAPLWSFHALMTSAKARFFVRADEIGHKVADLQKRLRAGEVADRPALENQLALLTREYQAIDAMPTWPVSVRIRRRLATQNLLLFVPVGLHLFGASDQWQQVVDSIQKAVAGQG